MSMTDRLRGLRCNRWLGDAPKHISCLPVMPLTFARCNRPGPHPPVCLLPCLLRPRADPSRPRPASDGGAVGLPPARQLPPKAAAPFAWRAATASVWWASRRWATVVADGVEAMLNLVRAMGR